MKYTLRNLIVAVFTVLVLSIALLGGYLLLRDRLGLFINYDKFRLTEFGNRVLFGVEKLENPNFEEYTLSAAIVGKPKTDEKGIVILPVSLLDEKGNNIKLNVVLGSEDNLIGIAVVPKGELGQTRIWEVKTVKEIGNLLKSGYQSILHFNTGYTEPYLKSLFERGCKENPKCKSQLDLVNRYSLNTKNVLSSLTPEDNGDEIGVVVQLIIGDYK